MPLELDRLAVLAISALGLPSALAQAQLPAAPSSLPPAAARAAPSALSAAKALSLPAASAPALQPAQVPPLPKAHTLRPPAAGSAPRLAQQPCEEAGPALVRLEPGSASPVPYHAVNRSRTQGMVQVRGGYAPAQAAVTPGVPFTLHGRCLGAQPGQVWVRFLGASAAPGKPAQRVMQKNSTALAVQVLNWSEGRITAQLPADLSGQAPGELSLSVQPAEAAQPLAPLSGHFWPRWAYHHPYDVKLVPQLERCADISAALPGACRSGRQAHAPLPQFQRGSKHLNEFLIEGAHQCAATGQGCASTGRRTDVYVLELPAWGVPVISDMDVSREAQVSVRLLPPVADNAPRQRPLRYALEVDWQVARPGEELLYVLKLDIAFPHGLAPAAPREASKVLAPMQPLTKMKGLP